MQEDAENEVKNPQNSVKKVGVNKYRSEEENVSKFTVELSILFTVRIQKKSSILIWKLLHCFLDQNCLRYTCYHKAGKIME